MILSLAPTFGNAFQAFDNGGLPLAGGLIYSYIDGGTTPQDTYTTSAGTTANSNPIVLDSAGRIPNPIWVNALLSYRFILTDALGTQIRTYDGIPHVNYQTGVAAYHQFTVQPTTTGPGIVISPAIEVTLFNIDGTINTTTSGSITLGMGNNPNGATLGGTKTQLLASGVATFNDITVSDFGLNTTLNATAIGLDNLTAVSNAFDVTAALTFTVQPSTTTSGATISPAVEVTAVAPDASTATSFTGNVTIAIGTNPGSGALSGTLTQAAVAGVATFSDLVITGFGAGYTLTATATLNGVTSGTSDLFTIRGAVNQAVNYTAASGGFIGQADALSFYNGILWANEQSGASANIVDVFNFTSGTPLIYQNDFGAARPVHGAINQQSTPPGRVTLVPQSADGNLYFMTFNGSLEFFDISLNPGVGSIVLSDEDDSINAIFVEYINSSHRIGKFTNINFSLNTATFTANLQNPGNLAFNSCAVDSRCYIRISVDAVGWLHTTTDVLTTLKTFANACSVPLLGGQFGGGSDTSIYVQSGDTNQANRLQRRDLDGALIAEATLSSISTTGYNTISYMTFDYTNNCVWAQSTAGIHCVDVETMTELAFIASGSLTAQLIQPIGWSDGGAMAFTDLSGSYYQTVSRLFVGN